MMGMNFLKAAVVIIFVFVTRLSAAENHSAAKPVPAEKPLTALNAVLFSEGEQSWTQRDFNLYKKILNHVPKKEESSTLSDSLAENFLISRLLSREAELFEIQPEKLELSPGFKTESADYSKTEINEELKVIALSRALMDLKEKQMSQKIRFKAWIEVLKRKYAVKIKVNDFTKTVH